MTSCSKDKIICTFPFEYAEIHSIGKVHPCCPNYCDYYSFGNILEQSFDEIWNGESAKKFRRTILNNTCEHCHVKICQGILQQYDRANYSEIADYPKKVKFCHDPACNVRCITCRKDPLVLSKEKTKIYDEKIETDFIPMLRNAEIVSLNGEGELFASSHMKKLVKRITEVYPDIKFEIHTNGILCNEKNCDELGITDKINDILLSLHAIKKETYDKLVLGGDFDVAMTNLKWLIKLKNEDKIKIIHLISVVNSYNYEEMPEFVKFAIDNGIIAGLWAYRPWRFSPMKDDESFNICDKNNKDYPKLVKIMKNEIFNHPNCWLTGEMLELKNS